jgi:hypothetical protein
MGRDDVPDWWRDEEASDAAADAAYEKWLERQVAEYLAANKNPRGRPATDRRGEIIRYVYGAVKNGQRPSDARAQAARHFGVSKSYIQRLTKKRT